MNVCRITLYLMLLMIDLSSYGLKDSRRRRAGLASGRSYGGNRSEGDGGARLVAAMAARASPIAATLLTEQPAGASSPRAMVNQSPASTRMILSTENAKPLVLFVEDEKAVREHLVRALSNEFSMEGAESGEDALKAILKRRPDLIVTDIVMPGMDGMELVQTLRDRPSTASIPILTISGRTAEQLRDGFEMGESGSDFPLRTWSVERSKTSSGALRSRCFDLWRPAPNAAWRGSQRSHVACRRSDQSRRRPHEDAGLISSTDEPLIAQIRARNPHDGG
jgi:CheY-like chemotaxis protein